MDVTLGLLSVFTAFATGFVVAWSFAQWAMGCFWKFNAAMGAVGLIEIAAILYIALK